MHEQAHHFLLWAGKLEPRKALPLALEALAKVDRRVSLLVAGDGPMRCPLEDYERRLEVEDRVQFLGKYLGAKC